MFILIYPFMAIKFMELLDLSKVKVNLATISYIGFYQIEKDGIFYLHNVLDLSS